MRADAEKVREGKRRVDSLPCVARRETLSGRPQGDVVRGTLAVARRATLTRGRGRRPPGEKTE